MNNNELILKVSKEMIKLSDDLTITKRMAEKESTSRRDDPFKVTEEATLKTQRMATDVNHLASEFRELTQKFLARRNEQEVTEKIKDISKRINLFNTELEYIDNILTSCI
jgi:hypothetical protein